MDEERIEAKTLLTVVGLTQFGPVDRSSQLAVRSKRAAVGRSFQVVAVSDQGEAFWPAVSALEIASSRTVASQPRDHSGPARFALGLDRFGRVEASGQEVSGPMIPRCARSRYCLAAAASLVGQNYKAIR